jgi:hypothetical protein
MTGWLMICLEQQQAYYAQQQQQQPTSMPSHHQYPSHSSGAMNPPETWHPHPQYQNATAYSPGWSDPSMHGYSQHSPTSPLTSPTSPSGSGGYPSYGQARGMVTSSMHGHYGAPGPHPPPAEVKSCSHCHATTTPLWRRDPTTQRPLCNACGLYLQQRNKLRPQELIDADLDNEEMGTDEGGPECSHCHTRNTSVWRRNKEGEQVCNACGVYKRLKGKDRPLELKRNKIKPRSKHN